MTLYGALTTYHRPVSRMMATEPLWSSDDTTPLAGIARAKVGSALDALAQHGGAWSSERVHARAWILENTEDFRRWCEEASLDPQTVIKRARQILAVDSTSVELAKPDVPISVMIAHIQTLKKRTYDRRPH